MKRKISLIVNGMFYGDSYTRRVLWGVFLLALAVVGLCIAGIAAGIWPFYLLALACAVFGFVLVRRNRLGVSSAEDDEDQPEDDDEITKEPAGENDAPVPVRENVDSEPEGRVKEASAEPEKPVRKDRVSRGSEAPSGSAPVTGSGSSEGKAVSTGAVGSGGFSRLRPSMKDVMEDLGSTDAGDEPDFAASGERQVSDQQSEDAYSGPRMDFGSAEGKNEKDRPQRLTPAEVGDSYSEKTVKKAFHKYKVKRNHRPLLIDHSDTYRIRECPAYGWVQKGTFYLLLLEQEPRRLELPESSVSRLYYKRAMPANQRDEYEILDGHNLISAVFSKYRPVYGSVIRRGEQQECKNLYMIKPDIMITAASARELMSIVSPELVVEDQIMDSDEYNQYFKQIYKLKIMLDDGVISTKDYPVKVKMVLQKLSQAPITPAAFRMTLGDMVRHGLISDEYARYYAQMKAR